MKVVTDSKYYDEIAKQLVGKGSKLAFLRPADMAEAVNEVAEMQYGDGYESGYAEGEEDGWNDGYSSGYESGEMEGFSNGYNIGLAEGEETGRQAQYDEFWDSYQDKGHRTDYSHAFAGVGLGWNEVTFKPKYVIRPKGSGAVHRLFFNNKSIKDFSIYNDVLDFSEFDGLFDQAFYAVAAEKIGIIKLTSAEGLMNCFQYSHVETIEKIILKDDGSQIIYSNSFNYTTHLKNIRFEGTIGASIQFPHSPLTRESLLGEPATAEQIEKGKNLFTVNGNVYYGGIFGALKEFETGSNSRAITLSAATIASLSEVETQAVLNRGWSIATAV